MLLDLGRPLLSSHASLHPLLPHTDSLSPQRLPLSGRLNHITQDEHRRSSSRSRRRTRPNSGALGPRLLHPNGGGPEGVPSSLFTFKPRATPKYTSQQAPSGDAADEATNTPAVGKGDLYAGLMEESDLPDISTLLVEARTADDHLRSIFCLTRSSVCHAPTNVRNGACPLRTFLFYSSGKAVLTSLLPCGNLHRSAEVIVCFFIHTGVCEATTN